MAIIHAHAHVCWIWCSPYRQSIWEIREYFHTASPIHQQEEQTYGIGSQLQLSIERWQQLIRQASLLGLLDRKMQLGKGHNMMANVVFFSFTITPQGKEFLQVLKIYVHGVCKIFPWGFFFVCFWDLDKCIIPDSNEHAKIVDLFIGSCCQLTVFLLHVF